MKKVLKLSVAASAAVICVMSAGLASAQEAGGTASASGQAGMALPGAAPQAAATTGDSDHDQMVGRLAVGYMGRAGVPIATAAAGGGVGVGTVDAPTVGVRYWIDQMIGIDVGLGIGMDGGSTTVDPGGVSTDAPGHTAFLIHGGVPLSLASAGHFSFEIIPELNVGFASSTIKGVAPAPGQPAGPDTDLSGFLFDIGARAGAEIHFGFMGIPQLSLQGSVGLLYAMQNTKATVKSNPEASTKTSSWGFQTTVNDNPWNIFTSNVAALYYF